MDSTSQTATSLLFVIWTLASSRPPPGVFKEDWQKDAYEFVKSFGYDLQTMLGGVTPGEKNVLSKKNSRPQ